MASTKVEVLIHDLRSLSLSSTPATSYESLPSLASPSEFMSHRSLAMKGSRQKRHRDEDDDQSSDDETREVEDYEGYQLDEQVFKRCRRFLLDDLSLFEDFESPETLPFPRPPVEEDATLLASSFLKEFVSSASTEMFFASIFQMEEERLSSL